MLAASGQAAYISEPLNVLHRPGVLITPIQRWYTYLCADNEAEFLPGLLQTLQFRYHGWAEVRSLRSSKDFGRMLRDWNTFARGRIWMLRPLLKDPFAVFSSGWFAERLNCQVVITVRHPAAFASSLKRLDWAFDLRDLLEQPLLMRDWLEPFRSQMENLVLDAGDVIGQGSLLWRMVYQVVQQLQTRYPQFVLVRHEDLSLQPLEGFRSLYQALGLDFSARAQEIILSSSSSENPKELARSSRHSVRLDSQANLNNWKRRLSAEEINRVRQYTEDIAIQYYPDIGWE